MDLVRYYLLGGDIAAPSELLARLCHAFLVYSFVRLDKAHLCTKSDSSSFSHSLDMDGALQI